MTATARRRLDVEDIRIALADRAADLARHLLGEPNPALSSEHEWRYGTHGSLSVVIAGEKVGSFFDHERGEGGDLIALIVREYGCSLADALDFARDFFGVVRTAPVKNKSRFTSAGKPPSTIVATYDYPDEDGALLFQVCRFDPKDFRQRRPDPERRGKWIWSIKGVNRVPYRLPDLIKNRDKVVVVVEGERDVDRLWQLGIPASCNAGGAGKWRDELSEYFRGSDVVIIPDRDPQKVHPKTKEPMFHPDGKPILPGQDHAQAVAVALHDIAKRVRVLELWNDWPDMPSKGDVSDWIENGGTAEALYALIEKAPDWSPPDERGTTAEPAPEDEEAATAAEIMRLARLTLFDYEQQRKGAAEKLGLRASILDRIVQGERGNDDTGLQGHAIQFPDPEPWPEPVAGAELLDEISKAIGSHVIMPEASRDAIALWAAHTYMLDATMISPRLAITSPTRGCGKTTALDVVFQLVPRPLLAANISASASFRVVEGFRPTLLIDEADSFLKDNDELRGILNSGHRKGGAVLRNVGDDHEPRAFSTYGACAIALIGQLPGTLTDRSVPILLTRRKRDETITPFRLDRVEHLVVLARKLARWTTDNAATVAATEPTMPAGLYNRAADNWAPLLAVATVAGGDWLARGHRAALAGVAADIDDAALLELLLDDIREIFAKREANKVEPADRIPSAVLAEALAEIEGRPWAEFGKNEKPITQNKLAKLLKPLVIVPENIRIGDKVPKGYLVARFEEAFSRYLGPEGASEPLQRHNTDEMGTSDLFQSAAAGPSAAVRKSEKPANDGPCGTVAVQKGELGEESPHATSQEPAEAIPEDRTCAQCGAMIDGKERLVSVSGSSVWLHPECQRFWLAALDEGHGPEGEKPAAEV